METGSDATVIADLRATARRIGEAHRCELIVLFGSTARGESASADLDIGVLCSDGPDLVDLTNSFIEALGVQTVDLADLRRADPLLMMLVARDGVPLHEAEPGAFARFASLAVRRYADTRKFRAVEHREIRDFLERRAL